MKTLVLLFYFYVNFLFCCTAFVIRDENGVPIKVVHVFDWPTPYASVAYNQANYGSFSFYNFSFDLPQSGMNEHGLVMIGLKQYECDYPRNNNKLILNELSVIKYILDNYSTVDSAILAIKNQIKITKYFVYMHYLLADNEKSIIISFIGGELKITDFNAITNIPHAICDADLCIAGKLYNNYERFIGVNSAIINKNSMQEILEQAFTYESKWYVIYNIGENRIDFSSRDGEVTDNFDFNLFNINQVKIKKLYPETGDWEEYNIFNQGFNLIKSIIGLFTN